MATTFSKPGPLDKSVQILSTVMAKYHQELADVKTRVQIVMAYNADGPAVKHAGYPALAKIKVVPLKDRVTKGFDAELLIDEEKWKDLEEASQVALMDHELSHLKPVYKEDDNGRQVLQIDDIGRPKLKTVRGDWNVGDGFRAVIERHGESAVEYQSVTQAHKWVQQSLFEEAT